jgi:hypothetical protein
MTCGDRWAKRVTSAVLQHLMRHASIQTTMKYYVALEADATSEVRWKAVGYISGNSRVNEPNYGWARAACPRHEHQCRGFGGHRHL